MRATVSDPSSPGGVAEPAPVDERDRERFAELLTSARQRSGRSIGDIAAATKISTRYLEALERGDVDRLPAGVYRRSIVRAYATLVGLDPRDVVERFDRTFAAGSALPDIRELQETVATQQGRRADGSAWSELTLHMTEAAESARTYFRWVVPVGAAVALVAGGVLVAKRLAARRTAEPPVVAAALPASERFDIRLPVDRDAAGTFGAGQEVDASRGHQLVVTSQPEGARVTVNGIGWGVTPLTIRHLPAGDKVVRVTKDGYISRERRIRLGSDDTGAAVRITLQPRGRAETGG